MSLIGPLFIRTFAIIVLLMVKVLSINGKTRHNHGVQYTTSSSQPLCPSKRYSWCLQIDGYDSIILDGNKYFHLKRFFQHIISDNLNDTDKHFHQFRLINNPSIKELEDNVFGDITVKRIEIRNCSNLSRFDRNAFKGQVSKVVEEVVIDLVTIADIHVHDFFESLNSLEQLKELHLLNHNIIKIIPFAFRETRLERLELSGPLQTISNEAFYHLQNLKILRLTDWVNHIPKNAFDFENESNDTLDIYFDIKFNSIEVGTFERARRPLTVNLYLKKLQFLDQQVFEPFLRSELRNDLMFIGELKDIKDRCKLVWLWRNAHKFRGRFDFKDEKITENDFHKCLESDQKLVNSVESSQSVSSNKVYSEFSLLNLLIIGSLSFMFYF